MSPPPRRRSGAHFRQLAESCFSLVETNRVCQLVHPWFLLGLKLLQSPWEQRSSWKQRTHNPGHKGAHSAGAGPPGPAQQEHPLCDGLQSSILGPHLRGEKRHFQRLSWKAEPKRGHLLSSAGRKLEKHPAGPK